MKRRNPKLLARLPRFGAAFGMAVFVLLVGVGCSDTDPSAPVAELAPQSDFSYEPGELVNAALGRPFDPRATRVELDNTIGTFYPGTTSSMELGEHATLTVGGAAILSNVTITSTMMTRTRGGKTEWVQWEFGPSMVFEEAIELAVDLDLINGLQQPNGSFYLWHKDDGKWVFSDEGKLKGDQVVFEIDHFSKYAVGD